jgi:hypothetical protein
MLRLDPVTINGIRSQSPYNYGIYVAKPNTACYLGNPLCPTSPRRMPLTSRPWMREGGLLSKDERQTFLNSLASIDGLSAGDWSLSHNPMFLQLPAPQAGIKLIALSVPLPYVSVGATVLAFQVDIGADGTVAYTPITGGPVTIQVLDNSGTPALSTFTTDLANTNSLSPGFTLNLQNSLTTGVYTLLVTATVNSQNYTTTVPIVVPPSPFQVYAANKFGPFYVFVIAVDSQGHVSNGTLSVTEGAVAAQGSGFKILTPAASGEVTVNGQKFTASSLGSRVIIVKTP